MGSERNDTMPRATVIDDEAAVQSIFCVFDTNDDGILDKDEVENFAKAFRKPGAPAGCDNIDKVVEAMDFDNGDAQIQFPEFEAYMKAVLEAKFASYDHQQKGYLVLDDMIDLVNDLVDPNSKQAKRKHFKQNKKKWFMKKFDKSGLGEKDDKVDVHEFQTFFLAELNTALVQWSKKPSDPLPYMLRQAVNVNPGQVSKQVRKLEKIHEDTVAKAKAEGVYMAPEDEEYDLTDVQSVDELKKSEEATIDTKIVQEDKMTQEQRETLAVRRSEVHIGKGGVYKEDEACCSACAIC